ncbi:hypothetical protein ONZ45_g169 [Pleurotus djamor]|nr:hypothetical protein ONZ45_g169 [Pleurotus djamor]
MIPSTINGNASQITSLKHSDSSHLPISRSATSTNTKWLADSSSPDPDDLFAKYPVSEVKAVQLRLRADADAKQEELRLMVGERYRDLLQASASIISIAQSSARVKEALEETIQVIQAQRPLVVPASSGNEGDAHLKSLQLLSAHMKLLLDAPEHLWRLIEKKHYLTAAWLFLLSRVVYRSLVQHDDSDEDTWQNQGIDVLEQFPLVQRQWEAVSQFRSQIIHRATMFLRESVLSSDAACAALLTLNLLDSKPLLETYNIFLAQRMKALRVIIASASGPPTANGHAPMMSRKREPLSTNMNIAAFKQTLHSILDSLNATVKSSRDIYFDHAEREPLLTTVLKYIQSDGQSSTASPSLSGELRLTTQTLLDNLPSSTHLSLLPQNMRSYKPYVDLASSSSSIPQPSITQKLDSWFSDACGSVVSVATQWFTHIQEVKEVWDFRASLNRWIAASSGLDGKEHGQLVQVFDNISRHRILEIWKASQSNAHAAFRKSVDEVMSSTSNTSKSRIIEEDTTEFLFQAPPLPTVLHASPTSLNSFLTYKSRLCHQLESRTAFLDEILATLENCAKALQRDLAYMQRRSDLTSKNAIQQLREAHQPGSQVLCNELVDTLQSSIATSDMSTKENETVFIARVADRLANASSLPVELGCGLETAQSFCDKSGKVRDLLIERYRESSISSILVEYHDSVTSAQDANSATRAPSCALFKALLDLQTYHRRLGYHWLFPSINSAPGWYRSFINRLLDGALEPMYLLDLAFLQRIAKCHPEWDDIQTSLTQMICDIQAKVQFLIDVNCAVTDDKISASQLGTLFAPFLLPPSTFTPYNGAENGDKFAGLLPHGSVSVDQQFKPALATAAPSTRFGLLLVGDAFVESPNLGHLAPSFFALHIAGGHIGLPFLVLTFLLSSDVVRHPTLINFCLTWIIYSVVYCLGLYKGIQFNDNILSMTCRVQAILIKGAPPMASVAGLLVVIQVFTAIYFPSPPSPLRPRWPATAWLIFSLFLPYIIFGIFALPTAVMIQELPDSLTPANGLYCTTKMEPFRRFSVPVFCTLIVVLIIVLEIAIGIRYYMARSRILRIFPLANRQTSPSMCARVGIFNLYSVATLSAGIFFISNSQSPWPFMVQAALPLTAVVVFGTQRDLFYTWCFWKRRRRKTTEDIESSAPNSAGLMEMPLPDIDSLNISSTNFAPGYTPTNSQQSLK